MWCFVNTNGFLNSCDKNAINASLSASVFLSVLCCVGVMLVLCALACDCWMYWIVIGWTWFYIISVSTRNTWYHSYKLWSYDIISWGCIGFIQDSRYVTGWCHVMSCDVMWCHVMWCFSDVSVMCDVMRWCDYDDEMSFWLVVQLVVCNLKPSHFIYDKCVNIL